MDADPPQRRFLACKFVSVYRGPAEPPMPVESSDVDKLPGQVKDGAKEFHLAFEHLRRGVPGLTHEPILPGRNAQT